LALDYSGDNASELKKVLEYFELIGDSEAYAAAEYIVGNMPGHRSLFGEYEDYYDNVDSLFDAGLSSEDAYDLIKRVSDSYGRRICYDFDCRRITSDYLIRDIESALNQWRE
jgi:hypothetical protein